MMNSAEAAARLVVQPFYPASARGLASKLRLTDFVAPDVPVALTGDLPSTARSALATSSIPRRLRRARSCRYW